MFDRGEDVEVIRTLGPVPAVEVPDLADALQRRHRVVDDGAHFLIELGTPRYQDGDVELRLALEVSIEGSLTHVGFLRDGRHGDGFHSF